MKRTLCTVVSLIIIGIAGPLWGATITVDTVDPGPAADGFCSLIEAIENANADAAVHGECPAGVGADVIELGVALIYTLDAVHNVTTGPNGLPVISSEIAINGHGSTVERDDSAPEFRILFVESNGNLTLNDLTVRNGAAGTFQGGAVWSLGSVVLNASEVRDSSAFNCGGLLNQGGEAELHDSEISFNTAAVDGGGLCNWALDGDATMVLDENSRVLWNEANRWGGGIYTATSAGRAANLELNGCKVSYNHADAIGGGAFQRYFGVPTGATSTLTVEDSEISHNTADGYGPGGISSYGDINAGLAAELIIRRSFISDNESQSVAGVMGKRNAHLLIEDTTISDNHALDYGGGGVAVLNGSDLQLIRSSVIRNTSFDPVEGGWAGGVGIADSDALISNSTVSGNSALEPGARAGGIGLLSSLDWGGFGASVVIEHSTVTGNSAAGLGGGIAAAWESGPGTVEVVLHNTIVADNHEQGGTTLGNCVITAPAFVTSGGFNLADDATCDLIHPDDLVVADAMLMPLGMHGAVYGGPTWCHVPIAGSPAIDSGPDDNFPPTDQRGVPRPLDGDGDGFAMCDRGSVEGVLFFMDGFESGDTSAWSASVP